MVNKKQLNEENIQKDYENIKDYMCSILGDNLTFSKDLERLGKQLYGIKFKGVFSSDKIPRVNEISPYAIINLDNSSEPGSHWVAIAYDSDENSVYMYDSYGRKSTKILPSLHRFYGAGIVVDSDSDAEQRMKENNCGQRSLAWLMVFDKNGSQKAKLI